MTRNRFITLTALATSEAFVVWNTATGDASYTGSETVNWLLSVFVVAPLSVSMAMFMNWVVYASIGITSKWAYARRIKK